jgi:hypothetical protein
MWAYGTIYGCRAKMDLYLSLGNGSHDTVFGNGTRCMHGRVTPTFYRRLAIFLRSLAIILPINYCIILPHLRVELYLLIYSHTRPHPDVRPFIIITLYHFDTFRWPDFGILPFRSVATQ